jgi:hypothetical protein
VRFAEVLTMCQIYHTVQVGEGKGVVGRIWYEYCIYIYVNAKIIPVRSIGEMGELLNDYSIININYFEMNKLFY